MLSKASISPEFKGMPFLLAYLMVIIIIEHLLKCISLTVQQSSCRFTIIDIIIIIMVIFKCYFSVIV